VLPAIVRLVLVRVLIDDLTVRDMSGPMLLTLENTTVLHLHAAHTPFQRGMRGAPVWRRTCCTRTRDHGAA